MEALAAAQRFRSFFITDEDERSTLTSNDTIIPIQNDHLRQVIRNCTCQYLEPLKLELWSWPCYSWTNNKQNFKKRVRVKFRLCVKHTTEGQKENDGEIHLQSNSTPHMDTWVKIAKQFYESCQITLRSLIADDDDDQENLCGFCLTEFQAAWLLKDMREIRVHSSCCDVESCWWNLDHLREIITHWLEEFVSSKCVILDLTEFKTNHAICSSHEYSNPDLVDDNIIV